jgi:AcrR family transcriptional regulator
MKKTRNSSVWIEEGYSLFAEEGLKGIQVERLARILGLNKSGFYHYFGDLDGYCEELIQLHKQKADLYLQDVADVKSIDPEYLHVVVKHKTPVMFHIHLLRIQKNPSFYKTARMIDILLREQWRDYLGIHEHPDLAIRYFNIVRDMFYARMSHQNMNYPFLHKLMTEARVVMQQLTDSKSALQVDEYLK